MANILIIYAHPDTKGYCQTILDEVKSRLDYDKFIYEIIDLYKSNYDPVLHEEEHYTSGNRKITRLNRQLQERILKSDKLIFIYPLWWGSMPAILKGFFDRVLTPGFAYKFVDSIPIGLLKQKKAIVFITSGSPKFISSIYKFNRASKLIKRDILGFCGIKTKVCLFGNARKLTDKNTKKIKHIVNKALDSFFQK